VVQDGAFGGCPVQMYDQATTVTEVRSAKELQFVNKWRSRGGCGSECRADEIKGVVSPVRWVPACEGNGSCRGDD
jgi:hypothetical protein